VRTLLLSVLVFAAQAAPDIDPYEEYLSSIKSGRPDAPILRVAERCGVNLSKAIVVYGTRIKHSWNRASNLKIAYGKVNSDFFASAEIWKIGGVPRVARLWDLELDTGSEIDTTVCMDPAGLVVMTHEIDWNMPLADEHKGWGLERTFEREASGAPRFRESRFIDTRGSSIPTPPMDEDEKKNLNVRPEPKYFANLASQIKKISAEVR
jgi:hypothetical protein